MSISETSGPKRLDAIARDCSLTRCLACGKCTASCPYMQSLGDPAKGKSPRHIVQGTLTDPGFLASEAIWFCPLCDVCTARCPSAIPLRTLFEALRRAALDEGHDQHCLRCWRCGTYLMPEAVHAHLEELLGGSDAPHDFTHLCPRCRALSVSMLVKESLTSLT